MAAFITTLLLLMLSSSASAYHGAPPSSAFSRPAPFYPQEPCFAAANATVYAYSVLPAVTACFSLAPANSSSFNVTGADDDDRVLAPPFHRRRKLRLPADLSSSNAGGSRELLYHELQSHAVNSIDLWIGLSRKEEPFSRNHRRAGSRPFKARRLLQAAAPSSEKAHAAVRASAAALLAVVCAAAVLLLCRARGRRSAGSTMQPEALVGSSPRRFSYGELAAATGDFAEERKVGRGGFGPVYRGCLAGEQDDRRRHVAVKVLSREQSSAQGLREFEAEVVVMSQLRHRNIVRLAGWCDGGRRGLLLVYELVPGGSLHARLYHPDTPLTWPERYKIALGLGSALLYLHTECDQCVVHGDVKPANVMVDASGSAKLGDFGLARLVDHGAEPETTQVVAGTVGYIDPELVGSRRPGADSDVYSFGVVLLEIACGRRPAAATPGQPPDQAAELPLLAGVRDMHDRSVVLDAADPRLDGEFDEPQMERLLLTGLWCAHRDPVRRPSMSQAMDVLRCRDDKLPVLEATMRGSGQIRRWESQAFGDLPPDGSSATSPASSYITPEGSSCLLAEE